MTDVRLGIWLAVLCCAVGTTGCRLFSPRTPSPSEEACCQDPTLPEPRPVSSADVHLPAKGVQPQQPVPGQIVIEPKDAVHQVGTSASTNVQPTLKSEQTVTMPQAPALEKPPPLKLNREGATDKKVRAPVVDALQAILDGNHSAALEHLRHYDQATQELFLRLLPALAQLSQKSLEQLGTTEVANLHEQLQSLVYTLRPRTELIIARMSCCEWVKAYGVFKPLEEGHTFVASSPSRPGELVQLYVELRNFASELRGEHFETRLASSVEIRDARGEQLWFYRFDDQKHPLRTRTLLNDYFNNYSFHVPHLPAGTYTLTIHVADETRAAERRLATKSMEFRVTAVPRGN